MSGFPLALHFATLKALKIIIVLYATHTTGKEV